MPRLAGQTGQTVPLPSLNLPKGPTSAVETVIRPGRRLPVGLRPPALKVWPHAKGSQSARGAARPEAGRPPELGMPMSARAAESWSVFPTAPWEESSDTDPKYYTGTSWPPALKASLGDWKDVAPSQLSQADLRRSAYLKGQLEQMRLTEFFDEQGGPHFQRLGLGFVAKQQKEIGSAFGSQGDLLQCTDARRGTIDTQAGIVGTSRSYLAAAEAIAKDSLIVEERALFYQSQVKESERAREGDVENARVKHLFIEVPNFEVHAPKPVNLKDLIPSDLGEAREIEERNIVERQGGNFRDPYWTEGSQMGWLFPQPEVMELSQLMDRWAASTRGANLPMGMCRSTFCRFLLDTKLADQKSVPYFWAVQLFDSVAQPVRCCPPNAHYASTAPVCLMVSRWRLISVLDAIIRQHSDAMSRYDVLSRIKDKMKELFDGVQKDAPNAASSTQEPISEDDESPKGTKNHEDRRDIRQPPNAASLTQEPIPDEDQSPKRTKSREDRKRQPRNAASSTREPISDEDQSPKDTKSREDLQDKHRNADTEDSGKSIERDSACRDRLLQSMLVEPEVLHLVFVHQEIFRLLYVCYAKDEQHMEFPELLSFCIDFYLIPQFGTESSLKGLYEAALCVEACPQPDIQQSISMNRTSISLFRNKANLLRKSIAIGSNGRKLTGGLSGRKSPRKRTSSSAVSRSSSVVPQKSKTVAETESGDKNASSSGLNEDVRLAAPAFRLNAFIETIVKLAFVHTGFYGNAVQLCSSSYFKVTWLLTYLRCVMSHMHACQDKAAFAGEAPDEQLAAVKALRAVPLDLWDRPPILPTVLDMPVMLQPLPGPGNRKLPRRRLRVQASAPRLRPSKCAEEQSTETWRRKRRMSMEETMMQHSTHKSPEAVVQKSLTRDSLKSEAGDSSSSEEEEYIGSVPPLEHSSRKSRVAHTAFLRSKSKTKSQIGEKLRGDIEQVEQAHSSHSSHAGHQPEPQQPHQGLLPLEDLFPVESGQPCFVDGECQLCGRKVFCQGDEKSVMDAKIQSFGNPHCRGCSLVDAISLQRHPFARLLVGADAEVKTAPLEAKPHVGKRLHPTFPLPPESGEGFGSEALQYLKRALVSDGRDDGSTAAK
eukprot:TRINITY_DN30721_c0_g1_i1.p1 TRINITY_DN30721_c0_g1~~TRINITY_DN30721_c0_g1_i1.p1  ORF type:complete len:1108 (-),score=196.98 TRINITY_DN30721_c0_g1_i1:33-3356(-)